MNEYTQGPNTEIAESSQELYKQIQAAPLSVLCGKNNSGKSFLIKKMVQKQSRTALYLGPSRYFNFSALSQLPPNPERKNEKHRETIHVISNRTQNVDNSPFELARAISEMKNEQRNLLKELMETLLGSKMEIKYTNPD